MGIWWHFFVEFLNNLMDYNKIYEDLIQRSFTRIETDVEKHHIIPRSLGGTDIEINIAYLTFREHYFAHLLLAKIYGGTQWFSVECFYSRHRYRFLLLKNMPRWVRKRIHLTRMKLRYL